MDARIARPAAGDAGDRRSLQRAERREAPASACRVPAGLAEAGYVEGKNLAIEYRFTNFRPGLMPEFAGDLVRLNANVTVASNPEAVVAARNATTSIPRSSKSQRLTIRAARISSATSFCLID
jgi:putative intracellular protease/amidase